MNIRKKNLYEPAIMILKIFVILSGRDSSQYPSENDFYS